MTATSDTTRVGLPADVGRVVVSHPEYRFLGLIGTVTTDWVTRSTEEEIFLEFRAQFAENVRVLMEFTTKVTAALATQNTD